MPTLTAATLPISRRSIPNVMSAAASATYPPVMLAVRVPPSACRTSQSTVTVRSPSRERSTTPRRERPTRRWISWVRPPTRPAVDSRWVRSAVARGSIAYSAVTQPVPFPRRWGGTRSSIVAAQSTSVSPTRIRQDPSAHFWSPSVKLTARISSGRRPEGRTPGARFPIVMIQPPRRRSPGLLSAHRPRRRRRARRAGRRRGRCADNRAGDRRRGGWIMTLGNRAPGVRPSGRRPDEMRAVSFTLGLQKWAEGSCRIRVGDTEVLCAATIEDRVPPHLRGKGTGRVTEEYATLPRATAERTQRESTAGRVGGRTHEIQRLIGRSLRGVVDLSRLGERTVTVDCDVLQADGGTRTASITGGYVALAAALITYGMERTLIGRIAAAR